MKIDIPIILAVLTVGGLVTTALIGIFGSSVKPNCTKKFDIYDRAILDLQLKQSASDEYKTYLEKELSVIRVTLDKIWNQLIK